MIGLNSPMPIMDLRNGKEELQFLTRNDLYELSTRGTASPDHVIRIKSRPLVLRESVWSKGREAIKQELDKYAKE